METRFVRKIVTTINLEGFATKVDKSTYALFICKCGREFINRYKARDRVKSCRQKGCTAKYSSHIIYNTWRNITSRCGNKKHPEYYLYGGRGIIMCDRWKEKGKGFMNFAEDMGEKPSNIHSIDRIDVNENYEPGNCRWATKKEQSNNRRDNVKIDYNGESLTIAEWAAKLNIKYSTLRDRIRKHN